MLYVSGACQIAPSAIADHHRLHGRYGLVLVASTDHTERSTFTAVPRLPDGKVAKQVVSGGYHTMILTEDGTLFACGNTHYGQLGLGDTVGRNTFTAVPPLPDGKVADKVMAGRK